MITTSLPKIKINDYAVLAPVSGYAQGPDPFQKENDCYIWKLGARPSILFSNSYSNYVQLIILPSIYLPY